MAEGTDDQAARRAALRKSARRTGLVVGGLAGLLLLWILSGQGAPLRFGGALVAAAALGGLTARARFRAAAAEAKCPACGGAFCRARTARSEALTGARLKDLRETQEDGSVQITTWTEDTFDVTETFVCAQCGATDSAVHQITRRRDETTVTEPAADPDLPALAMAAAMPDRRPDAAPSGRRGRSRRSG